MLYGETASSRFKQESTATGIVQFSSINLAALSIQGRCDAQNLGSRKKFSKFLPQSMSITKLGDRRRTERDCGAQDQGRLRKSEH